MKTFVLVLCLCCPWLGAAQSTLGPVMYTVPAGWSVAAGDESSLVLAPDQLEAVESLLLCLVLPAPVAQPAANELDEAWTELLTVLGVDPVMDEGQRYRLLPPVQTDDGRTLFTAEGRCSNSDGTYELRLYVLQEADLYLRAFALASLLPASIAYPPTSAIHNPRFAHQIPEFVLHLTAGASLPRPPAPARSLSGLWRGLSMFGGTLKNSYVYFYPDGRVFFASRMPMNGFEALPTDADAARSPSYWGRYVYDGTQGELRLPYQNSVFPFTSTSAKLTIVTTGNPHAFTQQASVDGFTFEGTYLLPLLSGEKPTLSLSAAGRFTDNGVLKYVDHWIYPFRISDQAGDGSYSVTNSTMVFRYSDGRVLRLPFSGLGLVAGDSSPAVLSIGIEDDMLTLITERPPRLVITADPANLGRRSIRWPASASGYLLQSTESLWPPAWTKAAEEPVLDGGDNLVTIVQTGPRRFFRLVK